MECSNFKSITDFKIEWWITYFRSNWKLVAIDNALIVWYCIYTVRNNPKSLAARRKKHGIKPRQLVWFYPMPNSRYNTMNFLGLKQELLHGLEPWVPWYNRCIPALGELRLRPPTSELWKHINIIYTSLYSISEGRRRQ